MNDLENKMTDAADLAELKEDCQCLRRQLTMLILAAVVGSMTLMGFIGMQSLRAGKDLRSLRPQLEQVSDAGRKQTTSLEGFTSKLQEYGRSHQDFMPIILKYGLTNSGPAALGSKK